jgi:hypothetical protein
VIGVDTGLAVVPAEVEVVDEQRQVGRRLWAAIMLASTLEVCRSILLGRRVRVDTLDPTALRRAVRGEIHLAHDYLEVGADMLEAIDECGPFAVREVR